MASGKTDEKKQRVVIVGGGFAGLKVARTLRKAPVEVVMVDRNNYHLFQPLLYQVATGTLSPGNIAAPLRVILRRQRNTKVVMGEVCDFDPQARRVILRDGELRYDTLVVAAGSRYNYFGNPQWQRDAPSLKSVEDATEIRRRVLRALEAAERECDPAVRRQWLSFVIVGGGPTGVELAGALAELTRRTFRDDFRNIDPTEASIRLVEGGDRVLGPFPDDLSIKAARSLQDLGVQVQTGTLVTDIRPDGVTLKHDDQEQEVPARTVLWSAGVEASPLGQKLKEAARVDADRVGRIKVQADLSLPGHREIFVIGDMAHCLDSEGNPLPGVAPVALQQGTYVGKLIRKQLADQTMPPFQYKDRGIMATIGRSRAVVDLHWIRMNGFFAWMLWLFVHLMQLVSHQNRVLVFTQWAWSFLTFNRSACLITGESEPLQEHDNLCQGNETLKTADASHTTAGT